MRTGGIYAGGDLTLKVSDGSLLASNRPWDQGVLHLSAQAMSLDVIDTPKSVFTSVAIGDRITPDELSGWSQHTRWPQPPQMFDGGHKKWHMVRVSVVAGRCPQWPLQEHACAFASLKHRAAETLRALGPMRRGVQCDIRQLGNMPNVM